MKTKTIISTKRRNDEHTIMQFPISLEKDIICAKTQTLKNDNKMDIYSKIFLQYCKDSYFYNISGLAIRYTNCKDSEVISMIENKSINLLNAFKELFEIDVLEEIVLPFDASEWFDGYGLSKEFKNSLIMSKLPAAANIGETKELCGIKYFYDYDGWHPVNTNTII